MTPQQLQALNTEITTDPAARGYAGMTDAEIAESLTTVADRQADRDTINGGMIASSLVLSEFSALAPAQKELVIAFMNTGEMPITAALKNTLANLFGSGQTKDNLIALAKRPGTRAEELKLGGVSPSDVARAKRL